MATYGPNLLGAQVSDSSPYVIVSSSPYYAAYLAFDGNTSTEFVNGGSPPHTLSVDFGVDNAKTVVKYSIRVSGDTNRNPSSWTFEGSNDNSNWDVLDTQTGVSIPASSVAEYTFNNSVGYRYYRLNITAHVYYGQGIIAEVTMHESGYLAGPFPTFHRV